MNNRSTINKIATMIVDGRINDRSGVVMSLGIDLRTLKRYIAEFHKQNLIYKQRRGKYIIVIPTEALRKRVKRGYYDK